MTGFTVRGFTVRGFTPEQLLAVADEFCPIYKVQIRSFSSLTACAAVPGARVHGVPVFDAVDPAARALADAVARMEPLTGANAAFGDVAAEVYRRWAQGG